ncbi:MAG: hypothetical protein DCC55_15820 [Chloroflexi bacterium]|nr:MAG: hypothetical protein DCC55_15820 [Chloroflexota bacterium]
MITGNSHASMLGDSWKGMLEVALEKGQNPLLNLGAGAGLLESLPVLVALHAFAQERRDITSPTVVVGGAPVAWLAALLHEPGSALHPSPPLQVVYGGPDVATHIASVELLAPPAHGAQIPAGLMTLLAPATQTGALLWETLPLAFAATPGATAQPAASPATGDRWLGWLGGGLALLLVILSLLF